MDTRNALAASVVVGVAAVIGLAAVTRTTHLGTSVRKASDARIAARIRQLDRYEASLARALRSRPPALPRVPRVHAPAAPAAAPGTGSSTPLVVYRRPAPVVVVKHTGHHGDEGEVGGGDGEGGGDG